MAATVGVVQTTTSGAGVPVAIDIVGTTAFQQIKLVGGQVGATAPVEATTAAPSAAAMGMVVRQVDSVSVTVANTVTIAGAVTVATGTVSISGPVVISPTTFTVNTAATVAGASVVVGNLPTVDVTTGIPSASSTGLIVAVKPGVSVTGTIENVATVSTILGTHVVTIATGGTVATLLGTVAVNVVAGAAGGGSVTTTQASGVTGQLMWLAADQTLNVSVSAAVSNITVVSTVGTLLGTVAVNVVAGGAAPGTTVTTQTAITGQLVWLAPTQTVVISPTTFTVNTGTTVVSGTLTVNTAATVNGASVIVGNLPTVAATTTVDIAPSVTALVVALKSGATVQIPAGLSVTVVAAPAVSGTVSISGTVAATGTIANVNTVSTLLGTVAVNVVAGAAGGGSVTTTQAAQTGQLIWLAPTQTITVNTAPTVAGASITIQQGVSVSAVVSGTVSLVGVVPVTTQASVSVTGVPVWWNPTAVVAITPTTFTVNTVTVAGASVTIQQGVSVSAVVSGTISILNVALKTSGFTNGTTGLPVWLAYGQTITLDPSQFVKVGGTLITGTETAVTPISFYVRRDTPTPTNAGLVVRMAGSVDVSGTVSALDVGRTNVLITVLSTSVGISGTTMPFGLYVGQSAAVSGTTSWVVPAGKTFRILSINGIVQNSVTTAPATVNLYVLASAALPTWTSAVPIMARLAIQAVSATVGYSGAAVQIADIPAGVTIALAHSIGTSGASIVAGQVAGYLFP